MPLWRPTAKPGMVGGGLVGEDVKRLSISIAIAAALGGCASQPLVSVSGTAPAPGATVRLASDTPDQARAEALLSGGGYRLGPDAAFLADLTMAERPVGVGVRTPDPAGEDQWRREGGQAAPWARRASDYNLTLTLTDVSTGQPAYSAGAELRSRRGGGDQVMARLFEALGAASFRSPEADED